VLASNERCTWEIRVKSDYLTGVIAKNGAWEKHISMMMSRIVGPGDSFFDVGANVGYHSIVAAKMIGETGRVIAFEPNPDVRKILEHNLRRNQCSFVQIEPRAISDGKESLSLSVNPKDSGDASLVEDHEGGQRFDVSTISLDDVCREQGYVPKCVKMDIQGMESRAILGAKRMLEVGNVRLFIEFAPSLLMGDEKSLRTAFSLLSEYGYYAYIARAHSGGAFEIVSFDILLHIAEYWQSIKHGGYFDLMLTKRNINKK